MMRLLTCWRRWIGRVDVARLSPGQFGDWAETQAERFLRRQGLKRLARNFRCGHGEVDLIFRDGETVVFVEVKAIRSSVGEPERKVNRQKRRRLISAARGFIDRRTLHDYPARFDIVTVKVGEANRPHIEHESDAFQAE